MSESEPISEELMPIVSCPYSSVQEVLILAGKQAIYDQEMLE